MPSCIYYFPCIRRWVWLERGSNLQGSAGETERERISQLTDFLGYPLLQSADILIYRAGSVPVGEDQVVHVELTREVARDVFNHLYGRESGFEEKAKAAAKKMGKKNARLYFELRKQFQEKGDTECLAKARALLTAQQNISIGDQERLSGYLEGGGKVILPEPEALLTPQPKMPGLDGQKMSKSYGNTIGLRESPESVTKKIAHNAHRSSSRETD